jgi:hypothetical protein
MASLYDSASLVMIPSGVKDGKVFSIKPTDGSGDFTFSRGTDTATRVNASGLIEKERSNQLLQSNTFDTTWSATNASVTGGQSGYDGSSDAWLLSKSAANGRITQIVSQSNVQSFSVYAKAGTDNWLKIQAWNGSTFYSSHFDLANGVIGIDTNLIDSSIESIGSGWYRCTISFNAANQLLYIYPADADGDTSGTSGNILIQDAQLE